MYFMKVAKATISAPQTLHTEFPHRRADVFVSLLEIANASFEFVSKTHTVYKLLSRRKRCHASDLGNGRLFERVNARCWLIRGDDVSIRSFQSKVVPRLDKPWWCASSKPP